MTNAEERIYRVLRLLVRWMAWIPLPAGRFLGRLMGTAAALAPLPRLRVALDNMRFCLGETRSEDELKRLYGRMFRHFGQMLFEVPHILRFGGDRLDRYVVFEGEENLHRARASGKGVFILTAHFGNWELMAAAFTRRFSHSSIVVRPVDFRPADRLLTDLRTLYGSEIIPKQRGMRRILAALRKGRTVGILMDQNVDWYDGAFVPFLGKTACTNKGLALMALKTGAPVLPVLSVRRPDGRYGIVIEPALDLRITGDKTRDVEDNTALFTETISRFVRAYPDHWFWFHRRWKTANSCPLPAVKEGEPS